MKLPTETRDLYNKKGLCGIFCMFYIGSSFINYSCPKINIEPNLKNEPLEESAFSRKRFFRGGSPSASTSAPTADFSAFHFSRDFWSCSGEENVPRKTNGTLEEGKNGGWLAFWRCQVWSQVLEVQSLVLKQENSDSISIFSCNVFTPGDQTSVSKKLLPPRCHRKA